MPTPAVLVLTETFFANAVIVKNPERLEQGRLRSIVFLETADALPRGFLGQQLVVLTGGGHAALVGLAGYKHLRDSVFVLQWPPVVAPATNRIVVIYLDSAICRL
jgi:hypothetical protein